MYLELVSCYLLYERVFLSNVKARIFSIKHYVPTTFDLVLGPLENFATLKGDLPIDFEISRSSRIAYVSFFSNSMFCFLDRI